MSERKVPQPQKPEGKDTLSSSYERWNQTLTRPGEAESQRKGGQ